MVQVKTPTRSEAPSHETVVMNPTGKKDDGKADEWATFVTLPAAGKSHTLQLSPREEALRQQPGAHAPHAVPVPGSGKRIRFVEGVFATNDAWVIGEMLKPECGFGRDYDINRHDPTGYWRKRDDFQFEVQEVVQIVGGPMADAHLRVGPATRANVTKA